MSQIQNEKELLRVEHPQISVEYIRLLNQMEQMKMIQEKMEKHFQKYAFMGDLVNKSREDKNKRKKFAKEGVSDQIENILLDFVDFLKSTIPKSLMKGIKFRLNKLMKNYQNHAQNFIKIANSLQNREDIPLSLKKKLIDEVLKDYQSLCKSFTSLSEKYGEELLKTKRAEVAQKHIRMLEGMSSAIEEKQKFRYGYTEPNQSSKEENTTVKTTIETIETQNKTEENTNQQKIGSEQKKTEIDPSQNFINTENFINTNTENTQNGITNQKKKNEIFDSYVKAKRNKEELFIKGPKK